MADNRISLKLCFENHFDMKILTRLDWGENYIYPTNLYGWVQNRRRLGGERSFFQKLNIQMFKPLGVFWAEMFAKFLRWLPIYLAGMHNEPSEALAYKHNTKPTNQASLTLGIVI